MTDENKTRTESIWVLYGSQTGNSEKAAKDFCDQIQEKFTPSYFDGLGLEHVQVDTTCIQLDDFLEYRHAAFTKTMVIFVSSYGVGQAPMGSAKFRTFVDELLEQADSGKASSDMLKGLTYAICGLAGFVLSRDLNGRNNLGDSDYTTYLENPTTITNALKSVGATEMIKMGEADAQEIGENSQENAIAKWKKELMIPLAKAVAAANSDSCKDDIQEMQKSAIPILVKIDPDYTPPKEFGGRSTGAIPMHLLAVAVIMALVAALFVTGTLEVP